MYSQADLEWWTFAWLFIAVMVLWRHWRTGWGVGLLFTFVVSFAALHWIAVAMYQLPWFGPSNFDATAEGLRQSTFGILGLAVGAELVTLLHPEPRRVVMVDREPHKVPSARLVTTYIVAGAALYALTFTPAVRVPSLTALIATGSGLIAVGIALKCWSAWHLGHRGQFVLWLASAGLLPFVTVVSQGFLGYGFAALLIIFAFIGSFYRPKWQQVLASVLLAYLAMSVYVTYMRDRRDIRDAVWGGRSMDVRIAQVVDTVVTFEWFDPSNEAHLLRVNQRLNQNHLVGAAVFFIRGGNAEFARGGTLWAAVVSVIPRAIWPDKPVVAGSGDVVSSYTGMRFAYGTSVGVGQVMEFYVNFGAAGVFLGFIVIGSLLVLADRSAVARLDRADAGAFLRRYLPALALLQIGGSLAEVTSSAAASFIVAYGITRVLAPLASGSGAASVPEQGPGLQKQEARS